MYEPCGTTGSELAKQNNLVLAPSHLHSDASRVPAQRTTAFTRGIITRTDIADIQPKLVNLPKPEPQDARISKLW